jgi:Uma2 family endonuclease
VDEYHRMIETGILDDSDRVELLEGYVVLKMPRNPPHDGTIQIVNRQLRQVLPTGWDIRIQSAITLSESEPEPDLTLVRGDERTYLSHHPGPDDVGLIIEVADSTLERDRKDKGRIYARENIPLYWIINLSDGQVEVYSLPSGPGTQPAYAQRQDFSVQTPGNQVPLILDGQLVAQIRVQELLP